VSAVAKANRVKLEKLLISEVSLVDDPANETPGWMVVKSKTGGSLSTITKLRPPMIMQVIDELAKNPELLSKVRDEVRRLSAPVTAPPSGYRRIW
jgi:hypothetical protein